MNGGSNVAEKKNVDSSPPTIPAITAEVQNNGSVDEAEKKNIEDNHPTTPVNNAELQKDNEVEKLQKKIPDDNLCIQNDDTGKFQSSYCHIII